jgi:hypothetical protein
MHGHQCFIYNEITDVNDLQIDHRVPFEVGYMPCNAATGSKPFELARS